MAVNNVFELIKQIKNCKEKGLMYPALFMCLAIPDVCRKISYPELNGPRQCKERYVRWFNEFVDPVWDPLKHAFPDEQMDRRFDGLACYDLRCAMLHAGETDIGEKINVDRFHINFVPFEGGVLYNEEVDYKPKKNDDGDYEWQPEKHIQISVAHIVSVILEAFDIFQKR